MQFTKLLCILLCASSSIFTQAAANNMLTESSLSQCISYSETLSEQESIINELDIEIDDSLNDIQLSENELNFIKSQLEGAFGEQEKELFRQYNDLNAQRNLVIESYKKLHEDREENLQIYNTALNNYNSQCTNVRVSEAIYNKVCHDSVVVGYCESFKFYN